MKLRGQAMPSAQAQIAPQSCVVVRRPNAVSACGVSRSPARGRLAGERSHTRLLRATVLAVTLLVAAAVWGVHGTRYESRHVRLRVAAPGAPGWTESCRARGHHLPPPASDPAMIDCARVVGRIVYRERRDPDGDGDAHLVVIAGRHVLNLKLPMAAGTIQLPGLGRRIAAVGQVTDGPYGLPELRVLQLR